MARLKVLTSQSESFTKSKPTWLQKCLYKYNYWTWDFRKNVRLVVADNLDLYWSSSLSLPNRIGDNLDFCLSSWPQSSHSVCRFALIFYPPHPGRIEILQGCARLKLGAARHISRFMFHGSIINRIVGNLGIRVAFSEQSSIRVTTTVTDSKTQTGS